MLDNDCLTPFVDMPGMDMVSTRDVTCLRMSAYTPMLTSAAMALQGSSAEAPALAPAPEAQILGKISCACTLTCCCYVTCLRPGNCKQDFALACLQPSCVTMCWIAKSVACAQMIALLAMKWHFTSSSAQRPQTFTGSADLTSFNPRDPSHEPLCQKGTSSSRIVSITEPLHQRTPKGHCLLRSFRTPHPICCTASSYHCLFTQSQHCRIQADHTSSSRSSSTGLTSSSGKLMISCYAQSPPVEQLCTPLTGLIIRGLAILCHIGYQLQGVCCMSVAFDMLQMSCQHACLYCGMCFCCEVQLRF